MCCPVPDVPGAHSPAVLQQLCCELPLPSPLPAFDSEDAGLWYNRNQRGYNGMSEGDSGVYF